jgi:bidirectional [NiFe] hydrogenase diaphorase subunit
MARHHYSGDSLIEVLHVAQEQYGYLTRTLLEFVARKLKLPLSHVLGVATFYHLFSLEPKAEHTYTVCLGTPCYLAGAQKVLDAFERGGCTVGGTTPDGRVTVLTARCVGSCGLAPLVMTRDRVLARVTPAEMTAELTRIGVR